MEVAAKATIGILLVFVLRTCPVSNATQVKLNPRFYVPKSDNNSTPPENKHGVIIRSNGKLRTREIATTKMNSATNLNNIICALCLKVTEGMLKVLRRNEFQKRIMAIFHTSCSLLFNFERECIATVNCFGFVFFTIIQITQPRDICNMAHLCAPALANSTTSFNMSSDKCEVCRYVVEKTLSDFKYPNKQLEIMESVIKTHKLATENSNEECKNIDLISKYAPMILANAEHFLKAMDLCGMTHACDSRSSSIMTDRFPTNKPFSSTYVS